MEGLHLANEIKKVRQFCGPLRRVSPQRGLIAMTNPETMKYVCSYLDRHGKRRWRFRRNGMDWHFKGPPWSPGFDDDYQRFCAESAPPPTPPPPPSVYFVAVTGEAIKIGYAANAVRRVADLQTAHPKRLKLLAVAPGPPQLEREYHRRFAQYRVRGEWFRWHPDILAEIERLST